METMGKLDLRDKWIALAAVANWRWTCSIRIERARMRGWSAGIEAGNLPGYGGSQRRRGVAGKVWRTSLPDGE